MKYRINSAKAYTKRMKTQIFLRWLFYALVLLFSYCLMCCGAFHTWQPYFIICLATAVSMREQEFSSSMFGAVCGFLLDIATGTLFGFHAVLLLPCCLMLSLLSRNLIKVNFINHAALNCITALIVFGMFYLFNFIIWNEPNSDIVFWNVFFPSFIATSIMAVPMYFLIKIIAGKFGLDDARERELKETAEEAAEDED